jgi:hypothetical protein
MIRSHLAGAGARVRRLSIWKVGAIGVAALAMGGVAYATIPTNGVISACYTKAGGALRVIDSTTGTCSSKETSLAWNVAGARGPQGETGPAGPAGPTGATGAAGAAGISGYEVAETVETRALPFDQYVDAHCPDGKVPLGGGAIAQLYNEAGFVGLGAAPIVSLPSSDGWAVRFNQPLVGGATKARFTVQATCAAVGP